MNRSFAALLLAPAFLLPACGNNRSPGDGVAETEMPNVRELWSSLNRYETYVRTLRDPDRCYVAGPGYPVYLASFARLYRSLWRRQKQEDDRREYIRILEAITGCRESDGTWRLIDERGNPSDRPSLLCSVRFLETFLDAAEISGDAQYHQRAVETLAGLKTAAAEHAPDDSGAAFLVCCAVAQTVDRLGAPADADLVQIGRKLGERAITTIDRDSGRWYGTPQDRALGQYDGHAAFEQLARMAAFLKNEEHVRRIYPDLHRDLETLLPRMEGIVVDRLLPSGTFRFSDALPDYTEGAALTVHGLSLYDRKFGTHHDDAIDRAVRTLLVRQVSDGVQRGAYWPGATKGDASPAHTDDVAWYGTKFLMP